MLDNVRTWIGDRGLISRGDKIVIGLSGGADSVCLFRILCELREELSLTLFAVHVNHGIRGKQADEDEQFSKQLAASFGVECRCEHYKVPGLAAEWHMTEEEAGRKIRYEMFEKERLARGAHRIAVAHHLNDQIETILFRMCRGTGIKGMLGMPDSRECIIRPLFNVTKEEILSYLKEIGQTYCEDSTNSSIFYDRNRIRHRVIPELVHVNEYAVRHISELSCQLGEIYDWLGMQRDACYKESVVQGENYCQIPSAKLAMFHPALSKEIVRSMIESLTVSLKDIEMRHIISVINLAGKESGKSINLPYGLVAENEYGIIRIVRRMAGGKPEKASEQIIQSSESENDRAMYEINDVYLPDEGILCDKIRIKCMRRETVDRKLNFPKNNCTKWFDCVKIKNTLSVRRPEADDYYIISNGCSKKLSRYVIDMKIPRQFRNKLVVIADGNHVLWIAGGRASQGCYVGADTESIMEIAISRH